MRKLASLLVYLPILSLSLRAQSTPAPIPIKVVIATTFENGADTGDKPGEFQFWVEREHLDRTLPFPG